MLATPPRAGVSGHPPRAPGPFVELVVTRPEGLLPIPEGGAPPFRVLLGRTPEGRSQQLNWPSLLYSARSPPAAHFTSHQPLTGPYLTFMLKGIFPCWLHTESLSSPGSTGVPPRRAPPGP